MTSKQLIEEFGNELEHGFGVFFVGAGVSVPSGLPDWQTLLRERIEGDLSVVLAPDDDLVQMAQYLLNHDLGNRGPLVQHLKRALTGAYFPNANHTALTQTNLFTVWTTNFDTLLEQAFQEHFAVDVKSSDDSISRSVSASQVEVIKIHGSIDSSRPEELVFASADYEDFPINRPAMAQRLKMDLLHKSFLFIGYSHRDPNIRNVLVEARRLAGNATRPHFLIAKKSVDQREQRMQSLWCDDLRRLGIRCAMIERFEDLTSILQSLARRSRGRSVYVTGSHSAKDQVLARDLGKRLALEKSVVVLDGQSAGASRQFVSGFTEAAALQKLEIYERLKIFPNPYANNPEFESNESLLPTLSQWRAPLMRAAQVVVAFDGGMGTMMEVELALRCGCLVIPVPGALDGSSCKLLKHPAIKLPGAYVEACQSGSPSLESVLSCITSSLEGLQ